MATTPPEGITEAIADLLRRSRRLSELAEELAAEYGVDISEGGGLHNGDVSGDSQRRAGGRKSRRPAELREYLLRNGPQKRKTIAEQTSIPKGTLAGLLRDYCRPTGNGRWEWVDDDPEENMEGTDE